MSSNGLAPLRRPSAYRQERAHVFPSDGSLEWYTRTHRERLVGAGALVKVGGQWFVHEQRFDEFVLTGGKVAA